jgi:hypothetical protein
MKASTILVLCGLACATSTPGRAAPNLLLHVETVTTRNAPCKSYVTETSIHRDGLVILEMRREDGAATFIRAQAPGKSVKELGRALNSNRVDMARGRCALDVFRPNEFFVTTITWFGRPFESNSFTVSSPGNTCPVAENEIYAAIQRLTAAALSNPVGRDAVDTRLEPGPHCPEES